MLTGLGLLYMQTGQEDKAQKTFTKVNEIDDYRADVINYLQLLEKLGKFKIRETDHFIIKVDGDTDSILLDQVAEQAEKIHREVCSDFAFEPKEKCMLEFFPTHQMFSIRITGKGWIGTVGALDRPRDRDGRAHAGHGPLAVRHVRLVRGGASRVHAHGDAGQDRQPDPALVHRGLRAVWDA